MDMPEEESINGKKYIVVEKLEIAVLDGRKILNYQMKGVTDTKPFDLDKIHEAIENGLILVDGYIVYAGPVKRVVSVKRKPFIQKTRKEKTVIVGEVLKPEMETLMEVMDTMDRLKWNYTVKDVVSIYERWKEMKETHGNMIAMIHKVIKMMEVQNVKDRN